MGCELDQNIFYSNNQIRKLGFEIQHLLYLDWKKSSGIERNYKYLQPIKRQQNNNKPRSVQSSKIEPFKPNGCYFKKFTVNWYSSIY